jgi:hypothetical protein
MQGAPVNNGKDMAMAKIGKRNWALIGGGVAACAACCAPLLLPLIGVAGGAGVAGAAASGMFGRSWAQLACDAVLLAVAASAVFLLLRARAQRRKQAAACACATVDGASCDVGGACDPKAAQP